MNPDTKLTVEQLKAICRHHRIPYHSHERITAGFSHEVHRLNDDLVIKVFNGDSGRRFETERALLGSVQPFRKPQLVASATQGDSVGRSYIIMTYVTGLSLGSHWHEASDSQRERLIDQVSQSLRVINKIYPEEIALKMGGSWRDICVNRGRSLTAKLLASSVIDETTAEKVVKVFEQQSAMLLNAKLLPVYWDIHFDNFIVSDDFELRALIDLENVELTSLDYPLFVVYKQIAEPEKYLREGHEKYAKKEDYRKLREWYARYYPEMFDFRDLESRVRLYQLLDILHLLVDWSHVKELYTKLDSLIS
jgi:aminoglycoside phosphotransferase (APT) family kinase protein